MRKLSEWIRLASTGALAITMVACADQSPTEVQLEPEAASYAKAAAATVTIYPASYTLNVGQVKQLVALPRDSRGRTLSLRKQPLVWASSNQKVATVSSTGRVTARSGGTAQITASYGGVSKRATITVRGETKVSKLSISASATELRVGGYAQLTATAKDASGKPVHVPLTWKSSNQKVIQVYANGLIKAVGSGSARISVSGGGASGQISISAGSIRQGPSKGSGVGGGQAPRPEQPVAGTRVERVLVFPVTESLKAGLAKQFIALPRSGSGKTVGGKKPVWKSSNPSVATVSATGLVRTRQPGTVTITATVDGVKGTASLTVTR